LFRVSDWYTGRELVVVGRYTVDRLWPNTAALTREAVEGDQFQIPFSCISNNGDNNHRLQTNK